MKRFDKLTRVCQAVPWDLMITQEFVTFQPQIETKRKAYTKASQSRGVTAKGMTPQGTKRSARLRVTNRNA